MSPFGACHGLGTSSADVNLQARAVSGNYTLGYWFFDRYQVRYFSKSLRFPQARGVAMATVAEYRKWAEECFEWARAASDEGVRGQYASLGRVWLERAAQAQLRRKIDQPEPKTAQKVA